MEDNGLRINKLSEDYLAQSITTDLLGDPFVKKGTPVVDTKVLAIGTKQIKQSSKVLAIETSYMLSYMLSLMHKAEKQAVALQQIIK